jgi:hypothetical protein
MRGEFAREERGNPAFSRQATCVAQMAVPNVGSTGRTFFLVHQPQCLFWTRRRVSFACECLLLISALICVSATGDISVRGLNPSSPPVHELNVTCRLHIGRALYEPF